VDTASLELHGFAFTDGSNVSGPRTTVLEADLSPEGRQSSAFRGGGSDRPAEVLQEIVPFLLTTTARPGGADTVAVAATDEAWGFTRIITWDSGTSARFTTVTGGVAPGSDGTGTESGTLALTAGHSVRVDVTRRLQLPSEHGVITVDQQIVATAEPMRP
jgi:hypothetical protein